MGVALLGDMMVRVIELNRKKTNTKSRSEVEEMIKKMRKEYNVMVKGQFEFVDAEGGFFEFTERMFPGDNIQTIQLIHGEICEIPMGLAKRLNNTKQIISRYKDVEQAPNGPIRPPRTIETKSRVRFVPVDVL